MASKNDKLRVIDQKPAITGGSALITQEQVIAPPAIGDADAPTDLVLVGQTIFNSSAAPTIAVSIAWNIPPNSTPIYYVIEYGKQSDYNSGTDTFGNPTRERANQESATLYLEPDTDYYIRVKAVYLVVQSPYTDFLSVHTIEDDTPPPDVTSLVAAFTNSNLVIDWDNPESYAFKDARVRIWNAGRTVQYATYYTAAPRFIWTAEENIRVTSGNPATSVSVDVTSRSYSNTLGNPVITSAVAPIPAVPSGIRSTWDSDVGLADESVIVSWLASDNAFSYDLTFNNHPATPYTTTDLSFDYAYNLNVNDHVPTLTSGNYSLVYRIRAKDKLHQFSATASGTIINQAPPAGIMSLSALGGFSTIGAIVALASGILDFDHFKWTVNNGVTDVQTFNSFTNDVIISNLTSGTYSVSVKAVDKFNRESAAKTVSGIVLDVLTIDELRAEAAYSDDRGTSVSLLNRLKDGDDATGVSFTYVAGSHWIKVARALLDRYKTISFRYNTNATPTELFGYFEFNDGTTSVYFAEPVTLGSAGQYTLTKYTTLGALSGHELDLSYTNTLSVRFQLPEITEARNIYFRYNAQPDTFTLYEFYPRRLVQTDDLDVEAVRAINISVGAVNANHISVVTLGAIQTSTGTLIINTGGYLRSGQTAYDTGTGYYIGNDSGTPKLSIGNASGDKVTWNGTTLAVTGQFNLSGVATIGTSGGLYQGTGTFASPTTGLKLFNSSGIGKLATYNSGVEQIKIDTDGKLKAASVTLDASGITLSGGSTDNDSIKWYDATTTPDIIGSIFTAYAFNMDTMSIRVNAPDSSHASNARFQVLVRNHVASTLSEMTLYGDSNALGLKAGLFVGTATPPPSMNVGDGILTGGLNVGSITGAASGEIRASSTISGPATVGSADFTLDIINTGGSIAIANNGTSNVTGGNNFSGLMIINDITNGAVGLFLIGGGGGIVMIAESVANRYTITSGTATRTNVYLDGSNRVTVENKNGASHTYRIMTLRTRQSL